LPQVAVAGVANSATPASMTRMSVRDMMLCSGSSTAGLKMGPGREGEAWTKKKK
jgi:hypothetical protein